jgi:DNA (cytosine-5)-methyltransferase 1
MTRYQEWPYANIDVLVGGTPCQSFSVAGLRKGMADPRGNLALVYLGIADKFRPEWVVWENVPGVLSSNSGRDFGAFLGGLGELGYGWAYRVLDAQYFGLAQRRKRVFVVGSLGGWQRAAAVLFERASMRGDSPPCREAGKGIANALTERPDRGGGNSEGQRLITGALNSAGGNAYPGQTLQDACSGMLIPERERALTTSNQRIDAETETLLVTNTLRASYDASEDGTGRGTPLVPVVAGTLKSNSGGGGFGSDPSETFIAHAFDARQSDVIQYGDKTGPLDTCGSSIAVAVDVYNHAIDGNVAATLNAQSGAPNHSGPKVMQHMAVRRLTPRECERLQGFPDDYTLIPYRGKPAADGPRYKALGNSMAVPCMRWIGRRIQMVEAI